MAYYIWHDEGCCDNREERLDEARRVQTALMAEGHSDVYITDEDHNVVGSTDVEMQCADEGLRLRAFTPCGNGDYICRHCGWLQPSAAAGAAELCRNATWRDAAEYERYAAVARAGGFDVQTADLPAANEQSATNPLLRIRLESDTGSETVEFRASDVLAYHMPGSAYAWHDLSEQDQDSFAEDYALYTFKRKFGDHGEYRVEIL